MTFVNVSRTNTMKVQKNQKTEDPSIPAAGSKKRAKFLKVQMAQKV